MKKGLSMTAAQVREHQERHGFLKADTLPTKTIEKIGNKLLQLAGMNKTEYEFSRILEAKMLRGDADVLDFKYEAITLFWGRDENTGKKMRYKADFVVRRFGPGKVRLIEVKGVHIWDRDKVRFRGCRAEWQWLFDFELWQKKAGNWTRLE